MDIWGFDLKIGGSSLDRSSLTQSGDETQKPVQLSLLESLDAIKQQDLKISVGRVGSTFKVEVKIDIPA
jgi:hypothetical protein